MSAAPTAVALERAPVLVVDDDQDLAEALSELFDDAGYAVQVANTGQEALVRRHRDTPWVLVLDLRLPDLDGLAVLGARRTGRRWPPGEAGRRA